MISCVSFSRYGCLFFCGDRLTEYVYRAMSRQMTKRSKGHTFELAKAGDAATFVESRSIRMYPGMRTLRLGKSDSTCFSTEKAPDSSGSALTGEYMQQKPNGERGNGGEATGFSFALWTGVCILPEYEQQNFTSGSQLCGSLGRGVSF